MRFEALEDRILHSADLLPLAPAASLVSETLVVQTTAGVPAQARSEIVFVDAAVPDRDTLLADLQAQQRAGRPIEIVSIGAGEDGIQRIGDTLAGRSGVDAVHVLAHGADGQLLLGRVTIDAQALLQRAGDIAAWSDALAADADLLLYGCDVAHTATGQQFLTDLAALTGADVAASTDATGAAAQGGNWALEFGSGRIDAAAAIGAAAQQAWAGTLAVALTSASSGGTTSATLNYDFSHNVNAGSDRLLIVELVIRDGVGASAVNFNGAALTFLAGQNAPSADVRVELWYLVAPTVTSGTVNVTLAASSSLAVGATSYSGVNQAAPFGSRVTTSGSSWLPSAVVNANGGDLVVDIVGARSVASNLIGSGQTENFVRNQGTGPNDVFGVSSREAGAASVTMSHTLFGSNNRWAAIAVQINQAGTGTQITASQDTYINSGSASNFGTATSLRIDHAGGGIGNQRALLQFDLSAVPAGATITGATLQMQATANGGAFDINVYRLTEAWAEGSGGFGAANWNQRLPGTNWTTAGGSYVPTAAATLNTGATGQHSWNLTNLVQGWVDSSIANHGIIIGSPDSGSDTVVYDSSEGSTPPRLVLTYTVGATAVVNTVPGAQSTNEDTTLVFSPGTGNRIFITDADAGSANNEVTLSVTQGSLTLAGTSGLSFTSGDGSADPSMTFRGRAADINTALDGLVYVPSANYNGAATLTLSTLDSTLLSLNVGSSLAGRYTFNAGDARDDGPGTAQNGSLQGAAAVVTDAVRGQVLTLDGNRDYVRIAGTFGNPVNVTLAAWVDFTAAPTNGGDVISLGDSVALRVNDLGNLKGFIYNGSTWKNVTFATALASTGWRHVAYTFDSVANLQKLYLDGVEVAAIVETGSISYPGGRDSYIGVNGNGSPTHDFAGKIDEARIYTRALSGAEIAPLAADLGLRDTDTVALTVNAVNDAPLASGGASLAAVNEDTLAPAGATVASLFGANFSDPADAGNPAQNGFAGVVVRGQLVDLAEGRWQYSTDGGSNWSNFGAIADAQALALGLGDRLRFLPKVDYHGMPNKLSVRLVDNSILISSGSTVDASSNGSTKPFSAAVVLASTSVLSVNDAPSGNDATVTTTQDTGRTLSRADFGFNDADGNGFAAVWIQLPSAGTLSLAGSVIAAPTEVTAAQLDASELVFMPAAGASGMGYASLGFQVRDDGGTLRGGIDLDPTQRALTIDVTASANNTAPSFTSPAGAAVAEGLTLVHTLTATDAEAQPVTFSMAGGADLARFTIDGSNRLLFASAPDREAPTDANLDNVYVVQVRASDSDGASSLQTISVTVTNVNEAPVVSAALVDQTAAQDSGFSYTFGAGSFTDLDAGDVLVYGASLSSGAALPSWLGFNAATRTFSGTPLGADVGVIDVRVTARDLTGVAVTDVFRITVNNTNDAPTVAAALVDQTAAEDSSFSYTFGAGSFIDLDAGDVLAYSSSLSSGAALPSWLGFNAATRTFSGTPLNADVGVIDVRVTARDLAGAAVTADFRITVDNTNDAPTLAAALVDQTATEDSGFSYTFGAGSFTDLDVGDVLAYTASLSSGAALPSWLGFNAATRTFSGTPLSADVGAIDVRVTARDLAGAAVTDVFRITVTNTNDAPTVASALVDQAATEDGGFSYTFGAGSFTDLDVGDVLGYSASLSSGAALPAWLGFNAATRTFSGMPLNADVGTIDVRVTARDLAGAAVADVFRITVNNTNDAPAVASTLVDQIATEGSGFSYTFGAGSFTDLDVGDVLGYSASLSSGAALPSWLGFNAATRTFSGTPLSADVGAIDVRVTARDLAGAAVTDTFRIAVSNTNDAPMLAAALADQTATEDSGFSYTFGAGSFTDLDVGDVLAYSASLSSGAALPSWLGFNAATRTFSGTPLSADVGAIDVRVTARDLAGAAVTDVFRITVNNTNDGPTVAAALVDQIATEGSGYSYTFGAGSFTDLDVGDVLGYSASLSSGAALPAWLGFNAATRTFSGTPLNADVGTIDVRVTAHDLAGAAVTDVFRITVNNTNDAPAVASTLVNQTAAEDSGFSYTFGAGSFADPDAGDVLGYSARLSSGAALPSWLGFNAATRTFSGTPLNADVGAIDVRVTVRDLAGAAVTDTFRITVDNTNDAPTLASPLAAQSATEDIPFTFTVPVESFADVDAGDTLSYRLTRADGAALPAWLRFDAATRTLSGTPNNTDVGVLDLHLSATDASGDTVVGKLSLAVLNVNDAPVSPTAPPDQAVVAGRQLRFSLPTPGFSDADAGDTLTLSATLADGSPLPDWLSFDAAALTFAGTTRPTDSGTYAVRVTATDSAGTQAQLQFLLRVEPAAVIAAPELESPVRPPVPAPSAPAPVAAESEVEAGDDTPEPKAPAGELQANPSADAVLLPGVVVTPAYTPDVAAAKAAVDDSAAASPRAAGSKSDAVLALAFVVDVNGISTAPQRLTQLLRGDELSRRFDEIQRRAVEEAQARRNAVSASVAATGTLSIGYVVWLVRGGVLMSSMLSALPAWQMIDPLPVLAAAGGAVRRRNATKSDDGDVEHLFDETAETAETADTARTRSPPATPSVTAPTEQTAPAKEAT